MRTTALLASLLFAAAFAHGQRAPDPSVGHGLAVPAESAKQVAHPRAEPDEAQLLSHRHYRAKDGHEVHSPAKTVHGEVPAGASAKCRDGSYSFSQHRRGTCSHHGGVGAWL